MLESFLFNSYNNSDEENLEHLKCYRQRIRKEINDVWENINESQFNKLEKLSKEQQIVEKMIAIYLQDLKKEK